MDVVEATPRAQPVVPIALVLSALALLTLSVVEGVSVTTIAPVRFVVILIVVTYRVALRWTSLVAFVIGVILFIPIRRYTLPASLPFSLEPYRFVVLLVATGWTVALLVDPRVKTRRTGFRGPLL